MINCTRNLRYSQSDEWIQNFVNDACGLLGMPYLDVLVADSSNACAVREIHGVMYITYDPVFLRGLSQLDLKYVLVVLLHEVGHLYEGWLGHNSRNRKEAELYADRVAGWLCFKMDLDGNISKGLFDLNGFRQGGDNHPIGRLRKEALIIGWNDAYNGKSPHRTMYITTKRKQSNNNAELLIGLGLVALAFAAVRRA